MATLKGRVHLLNFCLIDMVLEAPWVISGTDPRSARLAQPTRHAIQPPHFAIQSVLRVLFNGRNVTLE